MLLREDRICEENALSADGNGSVTCRLRHATLPAHRATRGGPGLPSRVHAGIGLEFHETVQKPCTVL